MTGHRQQTAHLGDFQLRSGNRIRSCVVRYRVRGRLNSSRSNAVLVLPWFQATSRQLVQHIGQGKLVDSSRYFVIAVDALGNGQSSSPSNSAAQRAADFPIIGVGDMVESEHQLVTRTLGLTQLHAVVGISMGGMQVFQWLTTHPDFMDRAVAIVGSPQSQADDRQRWESHVSRLQGSPGWIRSWLALVRGKPRTALSELLIRPHDHVRQMQAMMALDVAAPFGGSLAATAAAIKARLLVVGTWSDREVNPTPAFQLARVLNAEILELDGRCGHQAPSCEQATLWRAVDRFLASS